jgi:hypothetical protein
LDAEVLTLHDPDFVALHLPNILNLDHYLETVIFVIMGVPSTAASNAIIYLTLGAFL